MRVNQLKVGSVLSYLQMILSVVIGLVYTPIMLRLMGQSEYGLYNTVASTISMLSVLSLGFNSSYIRFYAKYKNRNDEESVFRLNGLFLIIFLIIGAVALLCGLFLSFHLKVVFDAGLTAAEYKTARILMLLLTVNLAVSFPMAVLTNIISAHEEYIVLKLFGMLKTVGSPLVTLPLLMLGFKSVAMVVATLIISLITDIVYFIFVKYKLKQRFTFGKVEQGLFKELFIFAAFIALELIVYQINGNFGKIALGRFHGTEAVAVYSVGYVLYHYYMQMSTSISTVFTPRVHNIVNATEGDDVKQCAQLTELFTKVGRVQYLILALVLSGVFFFGKPFIIMWAGEGYAEAYVVALMLMLSLSVDLIQNIAIEVQRAKNNHRFRSITYTIMAGINLLMILVLCPKYGVIGTVIGTAISFLLANGLIMNIHYHTRCNINVILFWKSIGRMSFGLIPPVLIGLLMNYIINVTNPLTLLLAIVSYTAVYCVSMWFFGMNQYEKDLFKKPLMLVAGRRNIK